MRTPGVASRGDTQALEGASQGEGINNQPSLAFFPADKTGYIAKVSALWVLIWIGANHAAQDSPVTEGYYDTLCANPVQILA